MSVMRYPSLMERPVYRRIIVVSMRKMKKNDMPALYGTAVRAFQADYEQYGVYPPLMDLKRRRLRPPRIFGKTVLEGDTIIGGAFILALGKKGTIGAVFLDPSQQGKGYGRQAMLTIEKMYPKVKKWKLETPEGSERNHRFYESLGYVKVGEMRDSKSGMVGFVYEKNR